MSSVGQRLYNMRHGIDANPKYNKKTGLPSINVHLFNEQLDPDYVMCKGCEFSLKCLGTGQVVTAIAAANRCRCFIYANVIKFNYGTYAFPQYITFKCRQRLITDYGARAVHNTHPVIKGLIRACLIALNENFTELMLTKERIDELLAEFKKHYNTQWIKI